MIEDTDFKITFFATLAAKKVSLLIWLQPKYEIKFIIKKKWPHDPIRPRSTSIFGEFAKIIMEGEFSIFRMFDSEFWF